jgi:hypothetical protein
MPKGGRGAIGHIEMHREKQKSMMRKHGDSGDREKLGGRGKLLFEDQF